MKRLLLAGMAILTLGLGLLGITRAPSLQPGTALPTVTHLPTPTPHVNPGTPGTLPPFPPNPGTPGVLP